MSKMSLYRASSGPTKSDIKLDGAETHRGYVLKNATQTHTLTQIHTLQYYTPPYPHTPTRNHLLLVSFLYRMYIGYSSPSSQTDLISLLS